MLSNSKFGFGLMRLPKDENGIIQQSQVDEMVDAFMDAGFTYFDTAYAYAGSENAIKKALVERYPRSSFTLADKLPAWKIKSKEDVARIFNESLEAAGVDYFDFYLLHSIEKSHYDRYVELGCFEFLEEMKKKGKIRHMGFSFHDDADFLEKVLENHPQMEFVQLQINYLDWENGVVQSRKNYEVCQRFNKPIVVMEPVKGGTLANLHPEALNLLKEYNPQASPASWALRFPASQPQVMTVLSGMSTMEQMKDNLQTMKHFQPLNDEELTVLENVKKELLNAPVIGCTACRYCTSGCPRQIDIPSLFNAYNSAVIYGANRRFDTYYKTHSAHPNQPASSCVGCRQCERVCPQHLPISTLLKDVSAMFDH